jgi:hypothetical protein
MPLRLRENGDSWAVTQLFQLRRGITRWLQSHVSLPWDRPRFELAPAARGRVAPERSFTRRATYTAGPV